MLSRHVAMTALAVLLSLLVEKTGLYAAGDDAEYRIKAALVYKLTKFVHWPEKVMRGKSPTFSLCMIGRNPFGSLLDAIETRTVRGKPLVVIEPGVLSDMHKCDMAFVSKDGLIRFPGVLPVLEAHSVLSVSDQRGFASQGGMVELARKGRRLAFKVNRKNASSAGVGFSAPFLDVVTLVEE